MATVHFNSKKTSLLVALSLSSSLSLAASSIPTAYLTATLEKPVNAKAPLTVHFEIDKARCEKAYPNVKNPLANCRRVLGSDGQPVTGLILKPKRQGYWRWSQMPNTATFFPAEPWNPHETLEVSLDGLTLPKATYLNTKQLRTQTLPLSANSQIHFWPSPDPQKVGSLVAELSFLTAVPQRAAVENAVKLAAKNSAVTLGSPTFLWEQDIGKDVALRIQWPILTTAAEASLVTFSLSSVESILDDSLKTSGKGLELTLDLPGTTELYQLRLQNVERVETDAMDIAYRLTLTPSLETPQSQFAKTVEIYELPEKVSPSAIEKADWTKAPVITEEVVKASRRLTPKVVKGARHQNNDIVLEVKAQPNRYLLIVVPQGFGPTPERTLKGNWAKVVALPEENARLAFMEPGNMLTLSGTRSLTLHAAGVKAIEWRLNRVRDPYLALTAVKHGLSEVPDHEATLATALTGKMENVGAESTDGRFITLKLDQLAAGALEPGLYDLQIFAPSALKNEEGQVLTTNKRILVSDIGLIGKVNQKHPVVFALDVSTGEPRAGLTLDLVGINGLALETVSTDSSGMARFSDITGLDNERRPVAIIARRSAVTMTGSVITPSTGGQREAPQKENAHFDTSEVLAWLPLHWETEDQFWQFDARGPHYEDNDLSTMLVTERALYRPGETVHIGAIAKKLNWSAIEPGTPLTLTIAPSVGEALSTEVIKLDSNGLAETEWTIPANLLPGLYELRLKAGETFLTSTNIRVQTFEPESMVLSLTPAVPSSKGWAKLDQKTMLEASLNYDFGSPAPDRTLRGRLRLSTPSSITFAGWKDFTFQLPLVGSETSPYEANLGTTLTQGQELSIPPTKTDEEGRATIALPLSTHLSSLQKVEVEIEGTDAVGARVTSADAAFFVSPYDYLLGWKSQNSATPLDALQAKDAVELQLALVDHELHAVGNTALTIEVTKRHYITELSADDRGYLSYRETPAFDVMKTLTATTAEDGLTAVTLPTEEPGDYALRVKDASGRVLSDITFFVMGNAPHPRQGLPTAHMKMALEKHSYEAGDTVKLSVLSPFDGTALLSLEANGVLAHQWAKVKAGQNELSFTLPPEADGKYWLTTSLVRASSWANRYMKAYSVATEPFFVNRKKHTLAMEISAPDLQTNPDEITFSIKADAEGHALLWAVDEALLRATNYQVEDPLHALMQTRGLMTSTYETLASLMPEGLSFPGLSPEGGDGVAAMSALRSVLANPFRRQLGETAVRWLGIVPVGPTAQKHQINLPPSYQGTLRIVALGANATQLGLSESSTIVRPELLITPSMPKFAAPGDRFDMALSLNSDKALEAALKASTTGPFTVSPLTSTLNLTPGKDGTLVLQGVVSQMPGAATLEIKATSPTAQSAEREVTMSIRPATLKRTESLWGRWTPAKHANGKEKVMTLSTQQGLLPFEAESELRVAPSPLPLMNTLLTTLSSETQRAEVGSAIWSGYPWALLAGETGLSQALGLTSEEVSQRLKETVPEAMKAISKKLSWQGLIMKRSGEEPEEKVDWFMSALALDYLLTLTEHAIPSQAQTLAPTIVSGMRENLYSSEVQDPLVAQPVAYAILEMTRAGLITSEQLEWLRQRLGNLELSWNWKETPVAIFMAEGYRLLHMEKEAEALMPRHITVLPGEDYAKALALYLTALNTLKDGAVDETLTLLEGAPAELDQGVALAALRNLVKGDWKAKAEGFGEVKAICQRFMPGFTSVVPSALRESTSVSFSAPGCAAWELSGAKVPLYWSWTQAGYPTSVPPAGIQHGLTLKKTLTTATGEKLTSVKLGDVITVTLNLSRYQGSREESIVVTDLFPAGFELMNSTEENRPFYPLVERIADEDRIAFVVEGSEGEIPLSYQLRATHPGKFTLPAADARSTRSKSVNATTGMSTISVEK